jgi:glucosamine 6-phosphate synthetase-like amidotransferase/phosphosugar isomerase protein
MDKSLEMLTSLISGEVKKGVFAAHATLRFVKKGNEHSYDRAVESMRKNPIFIAAQNSGADMSTLKALIMEQYKKHTDQLMQSLSEAYDLACNPAFTPIKDKDKK